MKPSLFLLKAMPLSALLALTAGQGCPPAASSSESPTITVQFSISARVLTSAGGGLDGTSVKFTAIKYFWDSYEEDWVLRRSMEQTLTTGTIGTESGRTGIWQFGYDLHKDETVFISATEAESGTNKEIRFSYSDAVAQAGGQTSTAYQSQIVLTGGI